VTVPRQNIRAICFRGDGTREDMPLDVYVPSVRLVVRQTDAPALFADDGHEIAMMTVEIEDLRDTRAGSSDGHVAIYSHDDSIRVFHWRIGRATWEHEIDRGLKWRTVASVTALLAQALGTTPDVLGEMVGMPKTPQECYYDGDIWTLLVGLYGPHRIGGVAYDTLWVRPQPACLMTGDLQFYIVTRRRDKCN